MFVVVCYDVAAGRTEKFRKLLSRYLVHEQNSVFCGLTDRANFREMEANLKAALVETDRILMLICENRLNLDVVRLGNDGDVMRIRERSVVL